MKRIFDIAVAALGLTVCLPVLALLTLAIFLQDGHSPLYLPYRVGRNGGMFRLFKLRSMVVGADLSGVDSTANDDPRITRIGRVIRRLKIDELPQFINVLVGDLSMVGPRPNVERETRLYSSEEKHILSVRPGITDFASIVFSDEGAILAGKADANIAYNQLIRPHKSQLALLYIRHSNVFLDIELVALTLFNACARQAVLRRIANIVRSLGGSPELVEVTLRKEALRPAIPPGLNEIVTTRDYLTS